MHQLYLSFPSPILQGRAYAAVTIPDGSQAASYGVLYLLHGASGRYTEWLEFTNAARYAADYGFITVMPATFVSYTTDMKYGKPYFTHLSEELIPLLHALLPIAPEPEKHLIAGLSMGGMGAFKLGTYRHDYFSAVGAFSSPIDMRATFHEYLQGRAPGGTDFADAFGDADFMAQEPNDIFGMMERLHREGVALPRYYHACGTEDHTFSHNERAHQRLVEMGIPSTYQTRPGGHTFDFWETSIQDFLRWACPHEKLQPGPALPISTAARPALEIEAWYSSSLLRCDLPWRLILPPQAGGGAVREDGQSRPAFQPPRRRAYIYPPVRLLNHVKHKENRDADRILHETALHLQQILRDFGVGVTVTDVSQGPAVTRYELQPDQGVKVSKIVSLADDIKLNLAVSDVRIEAPIPGKAAVGIEVPNAENAIVPFRELVSSQEFKNHKSKLAFAVGKDIAGKIVVTDIAKMPHLLIAGATGSGKSVCINTLIMSLLYKASPDEVKLIMIDPKVVELSVYNGIPHLLIPVVTDPKKAAGALNWAVAEMTHRYKLFADHNVRNLQGYNEKTAGMTGEGQEAAPEKLAQIVIVVDELADLMMVAPGEVEDAICRLAQLARAAGIHLVIATQRPSVNVITGLIKANMPSRIAFAVSSGVDSRTILDMNGAEKLLGKGDMLFYPYGYPKPVRVQGAFVSDEEVGAVVDFLKENNSGADYSSEVEEHISAVQTETPDNHAKADGPERDALFAEAGKFIIEKDKASIGMLQRWFKVGFNRAARIMDQLAEAGVVGEEAGTKPREILMTMEEFERYLEEHV